MFTKLTSTTYEILRWSRAITSVLETAHGILDGEDEPLSAIKNMFDQMELDECPSWVWDYLREHFPDLVDEFNGVYAYVTGNNNE